ncbi:phage baseplate assembly protein [Azorhizobium caulinodans]|uniref:phage baseplate assembly protein n=1 Tax=Azorhizobium caulinodans TaxID=7 RepID=UPI002FBDADB5
MTQSLATTRRFTLLIGQHRFEEWTSAHVTRDLSEISGSFELELRDAQRSAPSFPFATLASYRPLVEVGLPCEIRIDNEPVLIGWIETLSPRASEGQVSVSVSGRDKTGDLIDGAATVDGPCEMFGVKLDKAAQTILKPYGLKLRADVDVGAAFDRVAIDVGETGMSAIEKLARQRGLLVTSDGVGALVLTRSGQRRGPGDLVFPGNVVETSGCWSTRDQYSDYRVKGQAERAGGRRRKQPLLDSKAEPLKADRGDYVKDQGDHEKAGVTIEGRRKHPRMTRHRPLVAMARTQLTAEGAQKQADWMERTARAMSVKIEHRLKEYRGKSGALWRPNELVFVSDSFQGIARDMLIAGVELGFDQQGASARLRLCGPEAYDLEPEGNRTKNRTTLDSTAEPLRARS